MDQTTPAPEMMAPAYPELQDVTQRADFPMPLTVPVKHDGPLPTQELPAVLGTVETWPITTMPQVVLTRSQTRKRAILISTDNAFLVLPRRSNIGTNTGALWPANVPLNYTGQSELSVCTTTGTATLSVITEDWTR